MTTADRILQRLLLVLPIAGRPEGATVDGLAEELGVEPRRLLRDFEELRSRSYYLPAGLGDQIQIEITRERVNAWTTGEFQRPVRLTPREAMALELGLRILARRDGETDPVALRERLVRPLRVDVVEEDDGQEHEDGSEGESAAGAATASEDPAVRLAGLESGVDPIHRTVHAAIEARRELELEYRPPGRRPGSRRVAPLLLAHAETRWYLIARDLADQRARAFRVDRILDASATDRTFEAEEGDDAAVEGFLRDGRVHDGGADSSSEEVVVEYSSAIARWIREHGWEATATLPSGAVRVRHHVYDPEWLVRHVLGYGADARVVEPEWIRERIVDAARRVIG